MLWNTHSNLKGKHAILAPSQPSWLNYDDVQLTQKRNSSFAQKIGTETHAFAEMHIKHGFKLTKFNKNEFLLYLLEKNIPEQAIDTDFIFPNLQAYINDAISLHMDPEILLCYDETYAFGTADAISFDKGYLKIHDLKTGKTPAHIEQLLVYAALFCLEYGINPFDICTELRIYQNSEIVCMSPTPDDIYDVINKCIYDVNFYHNLEAKEGAKHVSR